MANRHTPYVERALASQTTALRFHLALACGVVVLGALMLVAPNLLFRGSLPNNLEWMRVLGSSFFSLLSGFPLKEIFQRRDKIDAMRAVISQLESSDPAETVSGEQYVSKMLDKVLGV